MATQKMDPIQKIKQQLADQKEKVKVLKESMRELKQALKEQKVSLTSAWQAELEKHTQKALSVGYEMGYLEAVAAQRDALSQFKSDMENLQNNFTVDPTVDFSTLDEVIAEAQHMTKPVPMPAPMSTEGMTPEFVVVLEPADAADTAAARSAEAADEAKEESISIESIVRDIVTDGELAMENIPEETLA